MGCSLFITSSNNGDGGTTRGCGFFQPSSGRYARPAAQHAFVSRLLRSQLRRSASFSGTDSRPAQATSCELRNCFITHFSALTILQRLPLHNARPRSASLPGRFGLLGRGVRRVWRLVLLKQNDRRQLGKAVLNAPAKGSPAAHRFLQLQRSLGSMVR